MQRNLHIEEAINKDTMQIIATYAHPIDMAHLRQVCKHMQFTIDNMNIGAELNAYSHAYHHAKPSVLNAWLADRANAVFATCLGTATLAFGVNSIKTLALNVIPYVATAGGTAVSGFVCMVGAGILGSAAVATGFAALTGFGGAINGYHNGNGILQGAHQAVDAPSALCMTGGIICSPVGGLIGVYQGFTKSSSLLSSIGFVATTTQPRELLSGMGIVACAIVSGMTLFLNSNDVNARREQLKTVNQNVLARPR